MDFKHFDPLKKQLSALIAEKTNINDIDSIYNSLTTPPDINLGHFAFPGFVLAKALKKAPNVIAAEIAEKIKTHDLINEATAAGPYLNIKLDLEKLNTTVLENILSANTFHTDLVNNPEKTMIEYSQPNTHKELHVGHMRNLCLGNALIRIFRYAGIPTEAVTYPGDVGTHVAKCLWYYKKFNATPPDQDKGKWLGELYTLANNKLEEERGTEQEDKNRTELTQILKELHAQTGEYFQLWKETRQWSIDLMNEVYQWADVKFDRWYFESDVDAPSLKLAQEYYQKGIFIKDAGAIGCDLSDQKLGFCLLIKTDGNGLYATKDIELARQKFEQGIKHNIYIVDVRQSHHFKQVFATLEKMGFEFAKNCHHLAYDFVELPDGAMSSRKGNIVPLTDLTEQMEKQIKSMYLEKYKDDWTDQEINQTAHIIANGAIKFGMNKIDPGKKIVFKMDEWLKLDGDSGPYIQYVCARINSIINKVDRESLTVNYALLNTKEEEALILKLSQFNTAVASSLKTYKTSTLCSYLYELAKAFNSFYAEHSVAKAKNEDLLIARLTLIKAVHQTLSKGLNLLGIQAPLKM